MDNEITPKQAVERMRIIEKEILEKEKWLFRNLGRHTIRIKLQIADLKQEAKEIYEKFASGKNCDNKFLSICGNWEYICCKARPCPNCQEIKEIWERINNQQEINERSEEQKGSPSTKDNNVPSTESLDGGSPVDLSSITRIEVIENGERKYNKWDCKVEASIQDKGRTLKLFVSDSK